MEALLIHVCRTCGQFMYTECVYASPVFRPESFFFLYKKYIEFNTVANLIRLHSYGRSVSRMTDELVNVSRMAE